MTWLKTLYDRVINGSQLLHAFTNYRGITGIDIFQYVSSISKSLRIYHNCRRNQFSKNSYCEEPQSSAGQDRSIMLDLQTLWSAAAAIEKEWEFTNVDAL